jgi:outer membrane lipoprotein carrier protein
MMNTLRSVFCCFVLFAFTLPSVAKSSEDNLALHLQHYVNLRGQFTQVISSEQSSFIQSSTGEFWIKKPNQFRWHYTTPYVQKIISNGNKLWVYDEDLEQVTIKDASQSVGSSPLAVILGSIELDTLFNITQLDNSEQLEWLMLTPKEDSSGFEFIKVGFKDGLLNKMRLHDSFGQTTDLLFTDVTINEPIVDETFEFIVPDGADVFEETPN